MINAHNEGEYLLEAIESVEENLAGFESQIIVIIDNGDEKTKRIFETLRFEKYEVTFSDVAQARNFGIKKCNYEWISVLDADDLWGGGFIEKFISISEKSTSGVYHPELAVYFKDKEQAEFIRRHLPSKDIDREVLAFENLWTSGVIANREVFLSVPYFAGDTYNENELYGYEDWTWSREILSAGFEHLVISETSHFIRVRDNSNTTRTLKTGKIPLPTELFKKN